MGVDNPTPPDPTGAVPSSPHSVLAHHVSMPNSQLTGVPPRIVLEQSSTIFRKIVLLFLVIALGASVLVNIGVIAQYHSYIQPDPELLESLQSGPPMARDKIAVITVRGVILDGNGFVKRQIDRVRKDDRVHGIVLRVDSPGGTVTASHYIYHHLKELQRHKETSSGKKFPIVVSMGSLAASGGYYVSMAVGDEKETIFAEETTWTGSIGVIIPSYDISGLLAKYDVVDRSYVSGDLKQMGSPTQKRTAQENAVLQQLVDESFAGFRDVVAYGRPEVVKDKKVMAEVVTGQIFTAKQAQALGLVDRLGYLEDATSRAIELAHLETENVRVVRYNKPESFFEQAFGGQARGPLFDIAALLDLTAPRAYYLCTWLPTVVSNRN
ncbi:MAG: signal peptide peptidase SppA [Pirellulales bacterium]|nr:signal peptide peptidase SppA [Pirellulales bacterium]